MSGVVVPDGWEIKALNAYTKLITKGTTPTTYGFTFKDNGINFIKAESIDKYGNIDVKTIQFINEETNDFLKRSQLKENDILFSIAGVLGRVAILKKEDLPANTNQALSIIRLKENNERYLSYFLQSEFILSQIKSLNVQMAQANLSLENLNNFQIIIPKEKKEQEKIAKILSTLDKNIENTNKIIEKEKNIKKALMQELLTNGIDKNNKIRSPKTHTYKQSKLGLIPEEWEVVSLGEIGNFKNGVNKSKDDFGFGIPFVNLQDVFGHWEIKHSDFDLVNATKEELKNYSLKKGDVLFIRSSVKPSGVGLTALVKEDMLNTIYSGFIIRFRSKEEIFNNDYKKYYFHDELFRQRLLQKSTVSANSNINQESLFSLRLLLPPIVEQKQIAKILNTQDKKIESEQKNLSKLQELKKGLMSDLLSGKVRVRV